MLQNLLKYISVVSVEQKSFFCYLCFYNFRIFCVSVVKNYLRKLNY